MQGGIVPEEAATATLDTAGSLYPSLPSDGESETGLSMMETGG